MWWINDDGKNSLKGEPQYIHDDGTHLKNNIEAGLYVSVRGGEVHEWKDDLGNKADPDNPMMISDFLIIESLRTVKKARDDFFKILPGLSYKERHRLNKILENSPIVRRMIESDGDGNKKIEDALNRGTIRTTGKYGGTGFGR